MDRREAFAELAKRVKDELVVCGIGAQSVYWYLTGHRPGNLYLRGPMGQAPLVGLGLALALPERKVLVLEGDGAFLMYLSSLATISHQKPANLFLVIIDNSCYESGGRTPTVNAGRTDFVRLAQGAGIDNAHLAESPEEFGRAYELALARGGPALLWAKVTPTLDPEPPLPLSREEIKESFLRHLSSRPS